MYKTDKYLELYNFDLDTRKSSSISCLAGVDEAGRGPLAGPVVAAAVIFKAETFIDGIYDSKKISEKQRLELYYRIRKEAITYGLGIVSHQEVDRLNILQATFVAMRRAVDKLQVKPELVLIDGRDEPLKGYRQLHLIKGDSRSFSVAAASIIAKVTRDRIMNYYHKFYPAYGFDSNKGYATQKHIAEIELNGRSPLHRKSFLLPFEKNGGQLMLDLTGFDE